MKHYSKTRNPIPYIYIYMHNLHLLTLLPHAHDLFQFSTVTNNSPTHNNITTHILVHANSSLLFLFTGNIPYLGVYIFTTSERRVSHIRFSPLAAATVFLQRFVHTYSISRRCSSVQSVPVKHSRRSPRQLYTSRESRTAPVRTLPTVWGGAAHTRVHQRGSIAISVAIIVWWTHSIQCHIYFNLKMWRKINWFWC